MLRKYVSIPRDVAEDLLVLLEEINLEGNWSDAPYLIREVWNALPKEPEAELS